MDVGAFDPVNLATLGAGGLIAGGTKAALDIGINSVLERTTQITSTQVRGNIINATTNRGTTAARLQFRALTQGQGATFENKVASDGSRLRLATLKNGTTVGIRSVSGSNASRTITVIAKGQKRLVLKYK